MQLESEALTLNITRRRQYGLILFYTLIHACSVFWLWSIRSVRLLRISFLLFVSRSITYTLDSFERCLKTFLRFFFQYLFVYCVSTLFVTVCMFCFIALCCIKTSTNNNNSNRDRTYTVNGVHQCICFVAMNVLIVFFPLFVFRHAFILNKKLYELTRENEWSKNDRKEERAPTNKQTHWHLNFSSGGGSQRNCTSIVISQTHSLFSFRLSWKMR